VYNCLLPEVCSKFVVTPALRRKVDRFAVIIREVQVAVVCSKFTVAHGLKHFSTTGEFIGPLSHLLINALAGSGALRGVPDCRSLTKNAFGIFRVGE
jgi:hypothetical protein